MTGVLGTTFGRIFSVCLTQRARVKNSAARIELNGPHVIPGIVKVVSEAVAESKAAASHEVVNRTVVVAAGPAYFGKSAALKFDSSAFSE